MKKPRHGKSSSRAYTAWNNMKRRCFNPNHPSYENYGGRGITVCRRWLDFRNFYEDMGDPPANVSLERIDNNLGYFPTNCHWSTWPDQMRNRRDTILLTVGGQTKPLGLWCEEKGIDYHVAFCRFQAGFTPEQVICKGKLRRRDLEYITRNNVTKTLHGWSVKLGLNYDAVRARIARGWPVEKALTTPVRKLRRRN